MIKIVFSLLLLFTFFYVSLAKELQQKEGQQPALTDYIDIYQKYISSIRGGSCQMYPSCSNFGMGAYRNYNPFYATFLTADRLLRCSHDQTNYNKILTHSGVRLVDMPVPNSKKEQELLRNRSKVVLYSALDTTDRGKFITFLISKKYYREALLELNREIFYYPDITPVSQYLNFLVCKRVLNELEDAIFSYENLFQEGIKLHPLILNEVGNLNYELGNFDNALMYYNRCISSSSDSIVRDKSILLKGLTFASQKKWVESEQEFLTLSDYSVYAYSKENCLNALHQRDAIRYKKPFVAGLLSIVPGLGYVYTGHRQTAISSVLINGLLAYASYSSYKSENYGMSALVSLFSVSFYLGNVSGSVKSAKRYNAKQDHNTVTKIKSTIYY